MWKKLKEQVVEIYKLISHRVKVNPLGSLLVVAIIISLSWILWKTIQSSNTGFDNKTLWDWMELLLVPLLLAVGVYLLNASQRKTEREKEKNREYQTTLEAYYDRMKDLLLKEGLRRSQKDDEVRIIARSLSLTVLKSLDAKRKGQVIQFLQESRLICGAPPVLNLRGADLIGADLSYLDLREVVLIDSNLEDANFHNAQLKGADLAGSSLVRANLSGVNLKGTQLMLANCYRANCEGAILWGAGLHRTSFQEANLRSAMLGDSTMVRDKNGELVPLAPDANIDETSFYKADLTDSRIGIKQLTNACLEEAQMPDGSSYEAWLSKQSKEFQRGREEVDRKWKEYINTSRNKKM